MAKRKTPKQRVLAKFRYAFIVETIVGWCVNDCVGGHYYGNTPRQAWAAAAKDLT